MMRLIWSQCVQTWVHRNTTESSPNFKHIKVNPVPGRERESCNFGALFSESTISTHFFPNLTARGTPVGLVFSVGQTRRFGGEFLVLRRGREAVVGLGVEDDVSEQFLAERGQRALPELARGLALADE
jgi:hypothetical protein